MAKKGQVQFHAEVNSDEEWKFIFQKIGLVVVDVYSDWCGPCVAMMSGLKKLKVESASEYLHLVIANADKVKALERFRGSSEPTFVLLGSGQLLRVFYGCEAPLLLQIISEELEHEVQCIDGKQTRIIRKFHELTPEEMKKQEEIYLKKKAEDDEEKKDREEQLDKVRRRYYERVARRTTRLSVVLFFPHTIEQPDPKSKKKICQPAYKMMAMYDQIETSIKDQLEIQLTKDTIPKVFYNSGMVFPKALLKIIEELPCMASLINEYDIPKQEDEIAGLSEREKELMHVGIIERKLATLAFGPSMDPFNPEETTVCNEFMMVTPKGVIIPPFWSPNNHISKAAALEVLFPYGVESLGIQMEPIPPPSVVVIFEGNRAREILDAAEPYANDVLHVGFFDEMDPATATKICDTIWEASKFPPYKQMSLRMVVALSKINSEPMLVLAQMNPLYMSPDAKVGRKETEMFFPPNIEEEEKRDPFAPPPKVEYDDGEFLLDEDGHRFREEYVEENGESVPKKHVIRLANGRKVDLVLPPGTKVDLPDDYDEEGEDGEEMEAEEVEGEGEEMEEKPMDEGERPGASIIVQGDSAAA